MECKDFPLKGYYDKNQFIVVEGKVAHEELQLLGSYGTSLDSARRKDTAKRGPSDKLKLELFVDKPNTSILTLHEAFFLAYSFGCLAVSSTKDLSLKNMMSLSSLWAEFRKSYSESNNKLDFAIEYGVYHYFRARGWIVKSGDNYGTNFLLYKESPSVDHSQYAAIIILEDDPVTEKLYNWTSLLTYHRVIQSVGKSLLITFVRLPSQKPSMFENPSCIGELRITNKLFSVEANTISKKCESIGSILECNL